MSNINGDLLDEGLQAVMGKDRCQNDGYVIFGDPKKKTTTEQRKATLDMADKMFQAEFPEKKVAVSKKEEIAV